MQEENLELKIVKGRLDKKDNYTDNNKNKRNNLYNLVRKNQNNVCNDFRKKIYTYPGLNEIDSRFKSKVMIIIINLRFYFKIRKYLIMIQ